MDRKRSSGRPVSEKVKYVKAQKQDRHHTCHWPGCGKQVPPAMWGCRTCWYKLPKPIRDKIWAAYRPGQEQDMRPSRAYLLAAGEAQAWIKSQVGLSRVGFVQVPGFPNYLFNPTTEEVMSVARKITLYGSTKYIQDRIMKKNAKGTINMRNAYGIDCHMSVSKVRKLIEEGQK